MARDASPNAVDRVAPHRPRPLWQLPVFVLGITALVGVWAGRPYWRPDSALLAASELERARAALQAVPPDLNEALARARRVADRGDELPQLAARADFLVGSALLLRADSESPETARETWEAARASLERAEHPPAGRDPVPEDDRGPLRYRLGRVLAKLGADPVQTASYLADSIQSAEDQAEGYRLLAQAYLAQTPPNVAGALDALYQAVEQPTADIQSKAPINLQIGELHLSRSEPDEISKGRQVLERIQPGNAPADVFFKARARLARSYEEGGDWAQVARNLEQIRNDPKRPAAEKRSLRYQLGLCYQNTGRPADALAVWGELVREADGPEPQAAAVRLAALHAERGESGPAAAALGAAVRAIRKPADFKNPLVGVEDARAVASTCFRRSLELADFDSARRSVEAFARLAAPGQEYALAAELSEAVLRSLSSLPPGPAATARVRDESLVAATHCRKAAEAAPAAEQIDWLRRSADHLARAGDWKGRLEVLDALLGRPDLPRDLAGELFFAQGETLRELGDTTAAAGAFRSAARTDGPAAPRARLEFALLQGTAAVAAAKGGDVAAYRTLLTESVGELVKNSEEGPGVDPVTHEASVFALGDQLYRLGRYADARNRLTKALETYPENPRATRAEFQIGRCAYNLALTEYRPIADELEKKTKLTDTQRQAHLRRYGEYLREAVEPLDRVVKKLSARQAREALSDEDAALLRLAGFAAAEGWFYLEKYDEAISRYGPLELANQGRVEQLVALSQLWQCYSFKASKDSDPTATKKAEEYLSRLKKTLTELPDAAFDGSTAVHKREYWDDWVRKTAKK